MIKNRNLSVGLFVSAALAVLMVFTIWITGKKSSEPESRYAILIEDDVSGLMLGGTVFFLGVDVGEVTHLAIVPGDPAGVLVEIDVLESTPVNSGTWATLAAQGITGVSVINLSNDPGTHGPLARTPGYPHPLIPYRGSGFSAILSSAPAILDKIETLLERATGLLSEDNQRAVTGTLKNLESISQTLADPETGLGELPASVNGTLTEIRATVEELRAMLRDASPGIEAGLANVQAATQNLAQVTERLNQWLVNNDAELDQFVGEGLGQVPALIADVRGAVREMDKLLAQMRRDPSGMIYKSPEDAVPVEED